MKDDILMIAQYSFTPGTKHNSRFHDIARMLLNEKKHIELVTTSFQHDIKEERSFKEQDKEKLGYQYTMLDIPHYKKNICLKRLYSNVVFSNNVYKYLKQRRKPDVVYCAIPSVILASKVGKYCKKNNIKFIIDIQDLWPEAFQMVFNIPLLSTLVFTHLKIIANKAYKQADEIIAVSDTYVNRAISVNRKCKTGHSVFLGTDLRTFDDNVKNNLIIRKDNEIWLAYCGTLGASYDLSIVFNAMRQINNINLKFIVMGDGPSRNEFEKKAEGLNVKFTGRLPYPKMCGILKSCDIAVNPIMHGAAQSIINKHADYAASGIPVLNTQESKEYRKLVDEYKMGFNCDSNDANDLAKKIQLLSDNKELRVEMGENARRCAQEKFDRRYSYLIIKDVIEENEDSCKN